MVPFLPSLSSSLFIIFTHRYLSGYHTAWSIEREFCVMLLIVFGIGALYLVMSLPASAVSFCLFSSTAPYCSCGSWFSSNSLWRVAPWKVSVGLRSMKYGWKSDPLCRKMDPSVLSTIMRLALSRPRYPTSWAFLCSSSPSVVCSW